MLAQYIYLRMARAPDPRDFINLIVMMASVKEWNDLVCDLLSRSLKLSLTSEAYYLRLRATLEILKRLMSPSLSKQGCWVPRKNQNQKKLQKLLQQVSNLRDTPCCAKLSFKILSKVGSTWKTS